MWLLMWLIYSRADIQNNSTYIHGILLKQESNVSKSTIGTKLLHIQHHKNKRKLILQIRGVT